jgi:hypothetical protein
MWARAAAVQVDHGDGAAARLADEPFCRAKRVAIEVPIPQAVVLVPGDGWAMRSARGMYVRRLTTTSAPSTARCPMTPVDPVITISCMQG